MTQLSLLDERVGIRRLVPPRIETPAARRTDPETSREAAEEITASGIRSEQQRAVLALIRRHPGRTAGELAELAVAAGDLELPDDEVSCYQAIQRRVSELEPRFVRRGEKRRCRRRERSATELLPEKVSS